MAMQQKMNIKLSQTMVMTPQLQMAIKMLQMPVLDLQEFIGQELIDNPFLTEDDGKNEKTTEVKADTSEDDSLTSMEKENMGEDKELALDTGWDEMYENSSAPTVSSATTTYNSDELSWENIATSEITLKSHLQTQLGESTGDPVLNFLGTYIIDAIDDAGYLNANLDKASERFHVPPKKMAEALKLIQTFDPAGVGARNLAECLRLQLVQDDKLTDITIIILDNLPLLARKEYGKLARMAKCSVDQAQEACNYIVSLTPKPGLKYGADIATVVIPDVIASRTKNGWHADLNAEAMPKILLNGGYGSFKGSSKDDKHFVSERKGRAQWLIKSLEQRARTIYKVANAIVKYQKDFFEHGAEHLKPMTLKTIADQVEAHESTISRVTNGKYMQTPMGVFELKYFFSSAIGTTGGNTTVAAESVRQMIKRLIDEESASSPLSDEKLVKFLKQEGVDVARRTVAKYREGMGIPSSSGRRVRL